MSKVFVSCGQRNEQERQLARTIAELLKSRGFDPYVAIEVQTVFEINSRLLRQLKDSDCYLFINLCREPLGNGTYRGSLFSHQEFAIAYALGFENIIVINQEGVAAEGMLGCIASNTATFENIEDCLPVVADAVTRAGWRNDYSRRLSAGNIRFETRPITYGELTGYFLYLDIYNHRPDIAALETTGRLSAYGPARMTSEPSTNRSPLKATGKSGFSHTIFPGSQETFDLLCHGWVSITEPYEPSRGDIGPPNFYLTTGLDIRPIPSLPMTTGIWYLKFEFFAIEFPLLDVLVELTIEDKALPGVRLIALNADE